MHNLPSAHAVAIEVTSLRGLPDNAAWMSVLEATAIALGGRPHWGQINNMNVMSTVMRFGSNVNAWRSALGAVVGSAMTFSNTFTALRGLEPLPGATMTLSGQRAGDLVGGVAMVSVISLLLEAVPKAHIYQSDWRWCHKSQELFFGGNPGSVCPAGGSHENVGSEDYTLAAN